MPDGTIVEARYQGELPSSAALPSQGRFIGEWWSIGNTSLDDAGRSEHDDRVAQRNNHDQN
jgi:hypothetical protein